MATYLSKNVFVSSLMFFVMVGSLNAQVVDINAICRIVTHPSLCMSYVKSNPKTSGADAITLAKITYGSAQTSASGALAKIQSLAKTETNPGLKQRYTGCVDHYTRAISNLNEIKLKITPAVARSPLLHVKVSGALDWSLRCQTNLENLKADPSVVKNNDDFQNICEIVLNVFHKLGGN